MANSVMKYDIMEETMKRYIFALVLSFLLSGLFSADPVFAVQNATQLSTELIVATQQLNVRTAPDVKADKISTLNKNTQVSAIAVKDGWFKIMLSPTKYGWISGDYVFTKDTLPSKKLIISEKAVVTSNTANLRGGAGVTYPKLTALHQGSVVTVSYAVGDWLAIRMNDGSQGFIAQNLVRKTKMALSSWEEPIPLDSFKKAGEQPTPVPEPTPAPSPTPNPTPVQPPVSQDINILSVDGSGGNLGSAITKLEVTRQTEQLSLVFTTDKPVSYSAKQDGSQITITILDAQGIAEGNYDLKAGGIDSLQVSTTGADTVLNILANADSTFTTQNIPDKNQFVIKIPVTGGLPNNETSPDEILLGKTIVIDAGHGGMQWGSSDPGAGGKTGLKERDVNLNVSKKIQNLLKLHGATVLMTRESNSTDLSLNGRALVANNNNADVFVSVHSNASTSPTLSGTSTYFYAGSAATSGQKVVRQKLATEVQNALVEKTQRRNIGVLQANFQVLRDTTVPSILVETAFISNPEEEALLADENFCMKIAEGIVNGLINFFTR